MFFTNWNCFDFFGFFFGMLDRHQMAANGNLPGQQPPGDAPVAPVVEVGRQIIERQRASIIQRVNVWIEAIAQPALAEMDLYAATTRLERGKGLFKQLEDIQLDAVGASAAIDVVGQYGQEFMEVEERYYNAVTLLNRRIGELKQAQPNANAAHDDAAAALVANPAGQPLFRLQMPTQYQTMNKTWGTFDGTLLNWLGFKDRFNTAVHSIADIPPRVKFGLLKDSLQGEAARALGGVLINDEGYPVAWEKLNKRFGPTYPLVRVYLDYMQSLPQLHAPVGAEELQRMSDVAGEVRSQLEVLNAPVDHWDAIFVHALHARLDEDNSAKWEDERNEEEFPTLQKMLTFLDKRANSLRSAGVVQQSLKVVIDNEKATHHTTPPTPVGPSGAQGGSNDWCPVHISFGHKIYDCKTFLSMTLAKRWETVKDLHLCENCLKSNHNKENCWDKRRCTLKTCQSENRHNSLLCAYKKQSMSVMNVQAESSSNSFGYSAGRGALSAWKRRGDSSQ